MTQTIRVTSAGNPIIGANGGGGPSYVPVAAAALSTTYTAENDTASAVNAGEYWRFQQFFKKGDVPSGSVPVLKVGGTELTTYGFASRKTWGDGSLRYANCTYKLDSTIAASGSQSVAITATTGSFDDTNTIGDTAFTDLSLKVSWDESGGNTYTSSFNDLVSSARTLQSTATHKTYFANELTHLAGGTDHARVSASWYVQVFEDTSTYRVYCELLNGYATETGGASSLMYVNGDVTLLSGATTLFGTSSVSFTISPTGKLALVDGDGLEYWHGGHPDMTHKHDLDYMITSGMMFRYAQSYASSLPTVSVQDLRIGDYDKEVWPDYQRDSSNGQERETNQGGSNPWIGPMCAWNAIAIMANAPNGTTAKRTAAQKYGRKKIAAYITSATNRLESNGYVPNLISDIATFSPLTARGNSSYDGQTTEFNSWGEQDLDHKSQPFYGQWALDGDPWIRDHLAQSASRAIGHDPPGSPPSGSFREQTVDGTLYFCHENMYQTRSDAWLYRDCMMAALTTPDGHAEKDYFERVANDYSTGMYKRATVSYANGGRDAGSQALGMAWPRIHWFIWQQESIWNMHYYGIAMGFAARAEITTDAQNCVDEYVKKFCLDWADLGIDRMAVYRFTFFKSDSYVLDGTTIAYSSWSDCWGSQNAQPTGGGRMTNYTSGASDGGRGFDCAEAVITGKSGTFTQGETVTGGTSNHSARIIDDEGSTRLRFLGVDLGDFTLNETLTGSSSGATATLSSRDYTGTFPVIVDANKMPGDTAPAGGDFDTIDGPRDMLVYSNLSLLGDLLSGTDQTNARTHADNVFTQIDSAYTDAHKTRLQASCMVQFFITYEGSGV